MKDLVALSCNVTGLAAKSIPKAASLFATPGGWSGQNRNYYGWALLPCVYIPSVYLMS